VEKSLAAVLAGRAARARMVQIAYPDIEATLGHIGSSHISTVHDDVDRTTSRAIGSAAGDGQRYRVLRSRARSGLGEVFVALDAELNREVALKQIVDHHADDPASRLRFMAEAEITCGLEQPGIAPVYVLGTYGQPSLLRHAVDQGRLAQGSDRPVPQAPGDQDRPRPAVTGVANIVASVYGCLQRHLPKATGVCELRRRNQPGREHDVLRRRSITSGGPPRPSRRTWSLPRDTALGSGVTAQVPNFWHKSTQTHSSMLPASRATGSSCSSHDSTPLQDTAQQGHPPTLTPHGARLFRTSRVSGLDP
jgi:hypothetical protein